MLTAADSALVGASPRTMKTMEIVVTRAFLHKGEPQKVGTKLTVDLALGCELVSMNKAERVPAPKAAAPAAPVAEVKPAAKTAAAK